MDPLLRTLLDGAALACFAIALAGCVHALGAAWLVSRRRKSTVPITTQRAPGVTLLKPLHGADGGLYDHLASFCTQAYAGPVQMLCGVQDPADPAVAIVERLQKAHPGLPIDLIVTAPTHARNPKIANLAGLQGRIAHDIVVMSDSDIAVSRDYLARTVALLQEPGTGLVTWLYRGVPRKRLWARFGAAAINHQFLPNVLVGLRLGLARPCFGSTIALRRETLDSIGGFGAFAACLADDYAIGAAVRERGLRVAIADDLVDHACCERGVQEWFHHELRWARTIRGIDPLGYAASVVTHPLPWALAGAAMQAFAGPALAVLVTVLACRSVLVMQADRFTATRTVLGLAPLRELLSFAVFVTGFFVAVVSWRGQRYEIQGDGTLQPSGRPTR